VHVLERGVLGVCSDDIQGGWFPACSFRDKHCYEDHIQYYTDGIRRCNAPKSWKASEAALVEVTAFGHSGDNEEVSDLALVVEDAVAMEEEQQRQCDCSKAHLSDTWVCDWRMDCRVELQQEGGVRARAAHTTSQNEAGLALLSE
jgi:hypothetical protein